MVSGSKQTGGRAQYCVSLAISLDEAARDVPFDLAEEMRKVASVNDDAFAESHHSPSQQAAQIPADWSNAYGSGGPAAEANTCMLRYRQVSSATYRNFLLGTAEQYRNADLDLRKSLWPGTMGNVILLMLNAHELTYKGEYLHAADRFARKAIELLGYPIDSSKYNVTRCYVMLCRYLPPRETFLT